MMRCLRLELPPALHRAFIDASGSLPRKPPSKSTLQRAEFHLDMALCLIERHRSMSSSSNVVRYSWSDSSFLLGFDWLWSQCREIDKSKLLETFDAVTRLSESVSEFVASIAHSSDDEE
eukprot:1456097-Pyramimonas_sp.AAC.1